MIAYNRRRFLSGSLAAVAVGCSKIAPTTPFPTATMPLPWPVIFERALKKASEWLASKQSGDGAWRSDIYGTFRDGTALTPLALHALILADPQNPAIPKAATYLAKMAQADGSIRPPEKHGFDFPLYTSALTVTALSHPSQGEHLKPRDSWLRYLKERQLTEIHGWTPEDREYGGWGYCHGLPLKPKPGEMRAPMTESNLSATTFALSALKAAGVPATDPAFAKAPTFVKRCQNWQDDEKARNSRFDDGGFFFIDADPIRNKSGTASEGRYHSYGSTTADGLRCLDMCGESKESPRQMAAAAWLRKRFLPDRCPGPFGERTEINRAAIYFYYAMSMAQTSLELFLVDVNKIPKLWKEALADSVISRQAADGSWTNAADAFRENDPIVATSFACIAIANSKPLAG